MKMKEVIFDGSKIQVGYRIKIPKPIIDTLNLKKGQNISIRFNLNKREIVIKEIKKDGGK